MIVTLNEVKTYLRVDSLDDNALIESLIESSEKLCMDIARVNNETLIEEIATTRIAILYATTYLYEHRENPDYNELTSMLRTLLFGIRQEVF